MKIWFHDGHTKCALPFEALVLGQDYKPQANQQGKSYTHNAQRKGRIASILCEDSIFTDFSGNIQKWYTQAICSPVPWSFYEFHMNSESCSHGSHMYVNVC